MNGSSKISRLHGTAFRKCDATVCRKAALASRSGFTLCWTQVSGLIPDSLSDFGKIARQQGKDYDLDQASKSPHAEGRKTRPDAGRWYVRNGVGSDVVAALAAD
jgi:hypothetical protein